MSVVEKLVVNLIFLVSMLRVNCDVISPNNLKGHVNEDITFWWNTTGAAILEVQWGLYNSATSSAEPRFITVSKDDGVEFNNIALDGKASEYKNRVNFTGNISQGKAGFIIRKLTQKDTNIYAAYLKESGKPFKIFLMNLTVEELTTSTAPPTSISTVKANDSSTSTPTSSPTASRATKKTQIQSSDKYVVPLSVCGALLLLIIIIVIIVCCFCPKYCSCCPEWCFCCGKCKENKDQKDASVTMTNKVDREGNQNA